MASQRHRVAVTDVRECYGSITSRVVEQRLRAIGAPEDGIDEVRSWLRAFREAGVDGLPVGPVASAVLADVVLAAGDDALREDRCELHPLGGRRRDLRLRSPGEGSGTG